VCSFDTKFGVFELRHVFPQVVENHPLYAAYHNDVDKGLQLYPGDQIIRVVLPFDFEDILWAT
jgi:hypothetical protein